MNPIVAGLVPVFGTIALGFVLRATGLVARDLWGAITRLAYQALLPAVLFVTISGTDYSGVPVGGFLAALTLGLGAMAILAFATKTIVPMSGPSFTSVFQGGLRINGFVVFALAEAAFAPEGVALVAIMFAVMVPMTNTLAVAVLTTYGPEDGHVDLTRVARGIAVNPLIIACVAGLIAAALPVAMPTPLIDTLRLAGRAALPLILLTVGANLDFSSVTAAPRLLALSVTLKMLIAPLVFFGLGLAFGLTGDAFAALMAIGAAPCAASAYVLAREMGGDAALMAGHVTVTTILAFAAMPFWIGLAA